MTTLQRSPRRRPVNAAVLDGASRARLLEAARASPDPFFPLGPLTAEVRARPPDRLVFELFSRDFPARTGPLLVLEDLPSPVPGAFGRLGRVWAGNVGGLKSLDRASLDAETVAGLGRTLDALRADALATFEVRAAEEAARGSRERFRAAARLRKALEKTVGARQDVADLAVDLADRLGPRPAETPETLAAALFEPPAPVAPSGPAALPEPTAAPAAAPLLTAPLAAVRP